MEEPPSKAPKPCPVCLVAMQATDEERHIVHRCAQCGAVIMVARLSAAPEKESPTMFQ